MIVDLPATTMGAVTKKLVRLREDVGAMALGRVLTLVVVVDEQHAESALAVANDATRQHPSRIVALVSGNRRGANRLDAQIRVGGDAGASEIVVLRLYGELTRHGESVVLPLLLADSPVVVWWPFDAPKDVAGDPVGRLAQRRITDTSTSGATSSGAGKALAGRAKTYVPGDTDLDWTRTTKWRGLLAAALDLPPYEQVESVTVLGGADSGATDLLAAWLGSYLDCPVVRGRTPAGSGTVAVRLHRKGGSIDLVRPDEDVATFSMKGQPVRRMSLPRRTDAECLADELARLDADEVYHRTLTDGLTRLAPRRTMTASEAIEKGLAPSVDEAREVATRLQEEARHRGGASMMSRPEPSSKATTSQVKEAAARRLEEVREERGGEEQDAPST